LTAIGEKMPRAKRPKTSVPPPLLAVVRPISVEVDSTSATHSPGDVVNGKEQRQVGRKKGKAMCPGEKGERHESKRLHDASENITMPTISTNNPLNCDRYFKDR
jgi:hypothetical protein